MTPETILFWGMFAIKVGKDVYDEFFAKNGDKLNIPSWEILQQQSIKIDELIAAGEAL